MSSVVRFLFPRLDIRGAFVRLDDAWQAMLQGRDYPQAVASLLGELSATVALIAAELKGQGRLTLQLKGYGAISLLLVDCDEALRLRGMARAGTCPQGASARELLGAGKEGADGEEGRLLLTLEQETGLYQSIVPLAGDTVSAIFSHYLAQSEQQEARLFLAADKEVVAGLFLQKMPAADSMDADGWTRLTRLADTVRSEELLGLEAASLLFRLFPEDAAAEADEDVAATAGQNVAARAGGYMEGAPAGLVLFPARSVSWYCPDNREKLAALIKSWGRAEAEAVLTEQGAIEIYDEIGNQTYCFDATDVARIFA
ncbi:MAG: Hsp33 family molecular chaperone HslO [Betaproteobacteria bacterium]|nr:Hsp33 family molecular chaperone HslO [Betaproteobacteria bacterium]